MALRVKTPTAVCAIRGTEFAVEHSPFNNESTFGVFDEGIISVTPIENDKEGQPLSIEKGNEVTISPKIKRYKIIKMAKLMKHRSSLILIRKNLSSYRARWKKISPEKREYLREVLLKKRAKAINHRKKLKNNLNKKGKIIRNKPKIDR